MMNPFSTWTAEGVLRTCEVLAIIAGVIAVGALIGQTMAGRIVNKRQAKEIRELDIKRLELEKQVSPRRLTGGQKSRLIELLSGKKGGAAIVSSLLDAESADFADDFNEALKAANWETVRILNRTVKAYGVRLGTLEGTEPLEYEKILDGSLTAIGVAFRIS